MRTPGEARQQHCPEAIEQEAKEPAREEDGPQFLSLREDPLHRQPGSAAAGHEREHLGQFESHHSGATTAIRMPSAMICVPPAPPGVQAKQPRRQCDPRDDPEPVQAQPNSQGASPARRACPLMAAVSPRASARISGTMSCMSRSANSIRCSDLMGAAG